MFCYLIFFIAVFLSSFNITGYLRSKNNNKNESVKIDDGSSRFDEVRNYIIINLASYHTINHILYNDIIPECLWNIYEAKQSNVCLTECDDSLKYIYRILHIDIINMSDRDNDILLRIVSLITRIQQEDILEFL